MVPLVRVRALVDQPQERKACPEQAFSFAENHPSSKTQQNSFCGLQATIGAYATRTMLRVERESVQKLVLKRVGMNVARICDERGIGQSELAQMASVDRSYLNKFLKGTKNASLEFLTKIADALNVPLASFFQGLDACSPSALPDDDTLEREYDAIIWRSKSKNE